MSSMPNGRKPGRPRDPFRAHLRAMFSEWSDRTFARYWQAYKRLSWLKQVGAIDDAAHRRVITRATRPNGTINVALFDQITQEMAAAYVAGLDDDQTTQDTP